VLGLTDCDPKIIIEENMTTNLISPRHRRKHIGEFDAPIADHPVMMKVNQRRAIAITLAAEELLSKKGFQNTITHDLTYAVGVNEKRIELFVRRHKKHPFDLLKLYGADITSVELLTRNAVRFLEATSFDVSDSVCEAAAKGGPEAARKILYSKAHQLAF
jgi:hypothetical protein